MASIGFDLQFHLHFCFVFIDLTYILSSLGNGLQAHKPSYRRRRNDADDEEENALRASCCGEFKGERPYSGIYGFIVQSYILLPHKLLLFI